MVTFLFSQSWPRSITQEPDLVHIFDFFFPVRSVVMALQGIHLWYLKI